MHDVFLFFGGLVIVGPELAFPMLYGGGPVSFWGMGEGWLVLLFMFRLVGACAIFAGGWLFGKVVRALWLSAWHGEEVQ